MSPNLLFQIFNWLWIATIVLGIVANEIEALHDYRKFLDRLKWFFLGGAVFHSILFFLTLGN